MPSESIFAPWWRVIWHHLRCAGRPGPEPYPMLCMRYSPQTGRTECSVCGFLYSSHAPEATNAAR